MNQPLLASLAAALLSLPTPPQSPQPARLLLDVEDTPTTLPSSNPASFAELGGRVYFAADDGSHGFELWSSDGAPGGARLDAELVPGPDSGTRWIIGRLGNRLLLAGGDRTVGDELWISDGTQAGTTFLGDLEPGSLGSLTHSHHAYELDRHAVFFANATPYGTEPWSTDGTASGTQLLGDVRPGPLSSGTLAGPIRVVVRNAAGARVLWFSAFVGSGEELWETDGTPAGTRRLLVMPRPSVYGPAVALPNGTVVYISFRDLTPEIWSTDGTPARTVRVGQLASYEAHFHRPVVAGNRAFFGGMRGVPFLSTDGTPGGLHYHLPAPGESAAEYTVPLGVMHGAVWGLADDGRVIRADPSQLTFTSTGTVGIDVDPERIVAQQGVPQAGGRFVLTVDDPTSPELWALEPLGATATRLAAKRQTAVGPYAGSLGGTVMFAIDGGPRGFELGGTDGTVAGTRLLDDIRPGTPGATTRSSDPRNMVAFGDRVVFQASTRDGYPLWITDGTAVGTVQISGDLGTAAWFTPCGDLLYFSSYELATGRELWATDGTRAGTRLVGEVLAGRGGDVRGPMAAFGDEIAFASYDAWSIALCASDGTTVRVVTRLPLPGPQQHLGVFRLGQWAMVRVDGPAGTELWRSDLTSGNATRIAALTLPGWSTDSTPVVWRDRLWFVGLDAAGTTQLFATDGTAAGTGQVGRLATSTSDRTLRRVVASDDGVFALARTALFHSDGTAAGTVEVPLALASGRTIQHHPTPGHTHGGALVFELTQPSEIWTSDGTAAGTFRLSDAAWPSWPPRALMVSGRRDLLFTGVGVPGPAPALWLSDGRPDGDVALQSLAVPSSEDGQTRWAAAGGLLVFGAVDPAAGAEPHVFCSGANVQVRDAACAAANRTPTLRGDYDPRNDPSATLHLDGWSAAGSTGTVFVSPAVGLPQPFAPIPHCTVDADLATVVPLVSAMIHGGRFAASVAIPRSASLHGVQFAALAATFPTDTPVGFDVTNGLLVTIGD